MKPRYSGLLILFMVFGFSAISITQIPKGAQILEEKGWVSGFALNSSITTYSNVQEIQPGVYRSASIDCLQMLVDPSKAIRRIVVYCPGVFTQRLVAIKQSTMEDVLIRYGKGDLNKIGRLVFLSYDGFAFAFDTGQSLSKDQLQSPIIFIVLQRGVFSATSAAVTELRLPVELLKNVAGSVPLEGFELRPNQSQLLGSNEFGHKICIGIGHISITESGFRPIHLYLYRKDEAMNGCPNHDTMRSASSRPGNRMWTISRPGDFYSFDNFYIRVTNVDVHRKTVKLEVGPTGV